MGNVVVAVDERLRLQAVAAGKSLGNTCPTIWQTPEQIAPELLPRAEAAARLITPAAKRLREIGWFWAGAVLFISGCAILIASFVNLDNGHLIAPWWINTMAWGGCLWLAGSSATKSVSLHQERVQRLTRTAFDAAAETIEQRKAAARSYNPSIRAASGTFAPAGPAPQPQPYGVSHEGAEALTAAWMRYLGESDADVTRFTSDGGIDVTSTHYIAQVKNYSGTVGVESVRELAGVSLADGRKPLFFTSGRYASGAIEFAGRVGVALFRYDAVQGTLAGENDLAKSVMSRGL